MIATDWQMYAVCPNCGFYTEKDGQCHDQRRKNYDSPCEFELTGGTLKTKIVPATPIRVEDAVLDPHS